MLLEIKDLHIRYEGAEVVKGVSINIDSGEIVTLIGSNGAGKTTILRAISGLKNPYAGEILFNGNRIDIKSPQEIVRMGIIQVPQDRGLFSYMSVYENMMLGAFSRKDKHGIKIDLQNVLEHFPKLKERSRQKAGTLSGGEQQMLAIAIALMGSPKLLIFDEPSIGLSPIMVKEISKIIIDINKAGTSILLVEQNARLALDLANRGYVLETGDIVLSGLAIDLQVNDKVRRAYLGG